MLDLHFYFNLFHILTILQTPYNYHRALVWTAVMATLSHVDPVFSSVVGIEAVNEEIMNSTLTPGYGDCGSPTHIYISPPDEIP